MVGRERPVASATAVMPPHPMASASQAAQQRRTFSPITGRRAWYLFRSVAMISASSIDIVQQQRKFGKVILRRLQTSLASPFCKEGNSCHTDFLDALS